MKKFKIIYLFILKACLITLFTLTACAPKIQEQEKTTALVADGPKQHDINLTLNYGTQAFATSDFAKENKNSKTDTTSLIDQNESYFIISEFAQKQAWQKKAIERFEELNTQLKIQKISLNDSIYLDLVYEQIHETVSQSVDNANNNISISTDKIVELLRTEQVNSAKEITAESTLQAKLIYAENFLNLILKKINSLSIMPEFKQIFLTQLKSESSLLLSEAKKLDDQLARSETIADGLSSVVTFLKNTQIQISKDDQDSLTTGQKLTVVLSNLLDNQDAKKGLQAIAIVWSMLDNEKRILYFKEANSSLYDFLSKRSDSDIQCLTESNCKGFKNAIILNLGVYPAIEKFGLKNIADLINQKGKDYLINKINQVAYDSLLKVAETLSEKIFSSVKQKTLELNDFKNNLRLNLSNGLQKIFDDKKITSTNQFLLDQNNNVRCLTDQGSYLRAKIHYLPLSSSLKKSSDNSDLIKNQFELVESLLNLPLFSQSINNKNETLKSDLTTVITSPEPRIFNSSISTNENNLSLNNQTDMLLTVSKYIREFSDWRTSTLDENLSTIQASDILNQFQNKDLNRSFFAKTDLIALSVSVAAESLKLLTTASSPLILIDNTNHFININQYNSKLSSPIAFAAVNDLKNGKRSNIVKANDLANFLFSLTEFYSATDGIEKTQSNALNSIGKSGKTRIAELNEARSDIYLLIVSLSNFLSHQFIQTNGLVAKQVVLTNNLEAQNEFTLADQTTAIQSLVRAYELTDIEVYLWSALDIYYSMNKNLFSKNIKFYQLNTSDKIQTDIDYNLILKSYSHLLRLKPYLNYESQIQLEAIYSGWLN